MQTEELVCLMKEKTTQVGTIVQEISSVSEAVIYAVDLSMEKKMTHLACPDLEAADRDRLSVMCKSSDLVLLDSPLREKASGIDLSLTWAEYGIADTGTVMIPSDSEEIRIATMLADIHVVILPVSRICPDTTAIEPDLDRILKQDSPSYTAFITGPSRTADIERVLAIGVHGPVELHLLLLNED